MPKRNPGSAATFLFINVIDYGFTNFCGKFRTGTIFRKKKLRAFLELSSVYVINGCNGISTGNGFTGRIVAFNLVFYFVFWGSDRSKVFKQVICGCAGLLTAGKFKGEELVLRSSFSVQGIFLMWVLILGLSG